VSEVFLLPEAQKDLDRLGPKDFRRVIKVIRLLSDNPRPFGSLKLTAEEGYRIRVGDYRILYRIDDAENRVLIYRVKHRQGAYKM
jgi:mRNA interferase RelE/StbE